MQRAAALFTLPTFYQGQGVRCKLWMVGLVGYALISGLSGQSLETPWWLLLPLVVLAWMDAAYRACYLAGVARLREGRERLVKATTEGEQEQVWRELALAAPVEVGVGATVKALFSLTVLPFYLVVGLGMAGWYHATQLPVPSRPVLMGVPGTLVPVGGAGGVAAGNPSLPVAGGVNAPPASRLGAANGSARAVTGESRTISLPGPPGAPMTRIGTNVAPPPTSPANRFAPPPVLPGAVKPSTTGIQVRPETGAGNSGAKPQAVGTPAVPASPMPVVPPAAPKTPGSAEPAPPSK